MRISSIISSCVTSHNSGSQYASRGIDFRWLFLWTLLLCYPSFGQQTVTYDYDTAGNRIERSWSRGGIFNVQTSENLSPITVPLSIDTLAPRTVRGKVSLDLNNLPLVLSEDEKAWLNDIFFKAQWAEEQVWQEEILKDRELPRSIDTTRSVGAIPLQQGISSTGARTYSIPIPTAAGFKLVPSVSLGYNSQGAEGWAGYGWDIQGVSCIRLINHNEYYHGSPKAADATASDPVFALDGVPLVTNSHSETSSDFPLETARGHILAAPEYNANNKVCRFTVLYPNGIRAIYGRSHTYNHHLVFFKLTEMRDLEGNKITFSYSPDADAGNDCLTAIRYGFDSADNYSGEITFTYTNWIDCPLRYFAGRSVRFLKRLTSIESRSDGEVLSTYTLSYQHTEHLWLLNGVDCSSGSVSLHPLEFTYSTVPSSHYLKKDNQSITINLSFFVPGVDNVYKRGKFYPGEYRDGIILYPGLSPYTYNPYTGYGSGFQPNQKIIFIPRLESSTQVDTSHLVCGNGFQTMDAVDIDGDGADEIVRVNMHDVLGGNTRYSITTYRCEDDGTPSQDSYFDFSLNGHAGTGLQVYPSNRTFRWGDFNGDGKADLLAVSYKTNYPGDHRQNCYTAIIDVASQSVLSDEVLFDYPYDKRESLIVADIDNDGRTELCHADENGFNIYRLQSSGHFALETTISGPTPSILNDSSRRCYMTDLNGDGYLDIIRTPASGTSSYWTVYYYTGTMFATRSVVITAPSSFTEAMFMDVNRDGMADMVTTKTDSTVTPYVTKLGTYINKNGFAFGSYQQSPSTITDAKGLVPVTLSAYNKPSAFMKFDGLTVYNYSYYGITASSRHITLATDSYGKIHSNGYAYLPSKASTWRDTSLTVNNVQGYKFYTLPISVLSLENHYLTESMAQSYGSMTYEYYNGVLHSRGLGFCGFSKIRTKEMVSPATFTVRDVADVYYMPEKMGVVKKIARKKGTGHEDPAYYTKTNTWDNHSTPYGKLNPRLTGSMETDAVTGITSNTHFIYDSWDYCTDTRTARHISGCSAQRERHTWTYQHSNTAAKYVLGPVVGESVTRDLDGDTHRQWKNKEISVLDTLFRPISRQSYRGVALFPYTNPYMEGTDSTLLVSETRWTYDAHGNVTSEKSAPYNATEFIGHTYTYDANGRYLLTDTDELGHTTTYVYYNKFGKPGRVDDYRGRNTYYSYDAWGNVTTVRRIDGSIESTTRAWGGQGAYTVSKSEAYGGPSSVSHFDGLGREIRRGVKRFDGQWQYTDTQYDKFGRINKTSLPFRGTAPTYWNTYTYDTYDRPIKILEPSGRETTWSYSGTSVTTVKDGIISTSTKDASGDVVSVQDAGGTITYTLRDDAQPSSITAPGNVETVFAYDNYGRRTSITDPSAGIRTESYVWNADGSHQQTHTGPHGSITTAWDKYGRITSVQRPGEFNTTYTYNNYGLLSSEQSTNSTGTEYTYDSYDRVSTVKETAPDGKWLKKTYTYGDWANLSTTKYTTQDGDITTETYSYANGNNTGVSITGGTAVWSLVSENDLGAPTEITTGSISRQYGFTAFGLPTYRKMAGGSLQHFTYQFNANNGNLTSRTDVINNKTESFKYDALNRLDTLGTRVVNYANNGNILSLTSVGSMSYGNTDAPYQVTSLAPVYSGLVPSRTQEITYNSLDRPSVLEEGSKTATFTYNAAGDRVKMYVTNGVTQELTRYYIGSQYEYDTTASGTKERLYLGGDAYSAPMVLQKVNNGSWTAYNIGRDYLGNITHIATTGGTLVAEYSYDPWGRLRSPSTLGIYTPGTEPELFLGRGFTGHEHLTWFGLINMNARLYDPLLGRFLSPDPYVQAPDFTQNFNRYSYALNNPLRYSDPDGEFAVSTLFLVAGICAVVFGGGNVAAHAIRGEDLSNGKWAEYLVSGACAGFMVGALGYAGISGMTALAGMSGFWGVVGKGMLYGTIATGAINTAATVTSALGGGISHGWDGLANAGKIFLGNFYLDENKSFWGQVGEGILRHTWEAPQQAIGYFLSSARNTVGAADRVDFYSGATYVTNENTDNYQGVTLGSMINMDIWNEIPSNKTFDYYVENDDQMYAHEYGHTIQSRCFGLAYPIIGLLSLGSAMSEFVFKTGHKHNSFFTEVMANRFAQPLFPTYTWGTNKYPILY